MNDNPEFDKWVESLSNPTAKQRACISKVIRHLNAYFTLCREGNICVDEVFTGSLHNVLNQAYSSSPEYYYRLIGELYFEKELNMPPMFYKKKASDKVWWVDTSAQTGIMEFSIDKKKVYNLFRDYPHALTSEDKKIFDKENPYWKKFFRGRTNKRRISDDSKTKT